uniref:RPA-related protein RADX n=1 Tax=Euleptes europaea TaxID=460621 RepID=UPI002541F6BD|nr:RPA-related protein RADX [Euleptes europaea]
MEGPEGVGGPEAVAEAAAAAGCDSWIQRAFEQVLASSSLRLSLPTGRPVAVLALERYMADAPSPGTPSKPTVGGGHVHVAPSSSYCYDVTVWDGVYQEKCLLAPELNPLVHKNALRCGLWVEIMQCSYMYNERKLGAGFLCVEKLRIVGAPGVDISPEQKEYKAKPRVPLKGAKKHYLPLWNNEDPYGGVWVEKKLSQDVCVDDSKLTSLSHLEMSWRTKMSFPPLLVRVLHKARLRYYGKPDTKLDVPYQAYFEVADHSGMMSVVLWNSLCLEWYSSMKIGTVLLLHQYAVKTSYPFKTQPTPGDLHMKRFSSIEISLNVRDPPTKIHIIPESKVKKEWKLPDVKYRFITRSELDNLPNNHSCDIIGLVKYVGRTERTRKREYGEDFWIHRWVHVVDGTSEEPFILELFATSQPEIFEQIHPMTYLVCTQMRVVRDTVESGFTTYLTTSNESQMFITGWHKGQPYTKDTKVKSFIQWINTQKEDYHMEKTAIGGYYPFPPVPNTFSKYCKNSKVESVLTTISEMEKEIESLHYREHKRIAIQGIISAIRYVSCGRTSQDASGVEAIQINKEPLFQSSVSKSNRVKEGRKKFQPLRETRSVQRSPPSMQEQQYVVTKKSPAKRKSETVEKRESPGSKSPYFTRSAGKKTMMHTDLKENCLSRKKSQEETELTQPSRTGNKEKSNVPETVQAERICHNSWQSALWTAVKDNLTQHLHYSRVSPESFPCKFEYMHKEFLMQRYNLQAAQCKPKEWKTKEGMDCFENTCPLEYYEVAILGINHDIAVDVAFLPVCCPEDSHLFRAEDVLNDAVLTSVSGTPCQQEAINKEGLSELFSLSDEVVKAAADLEKQRVVCILDVCSLSEDEVEVFLNKVYKVTEADITNQT